MPSRQLPTTITSPPPHHNNHHHLVPPLVGSMTAAFSILILFISCYRRQRTVPSSDTTTKPLRRFSYSSLRRATSSFSPSLHLGHGGFGSVFRGTIKPDLQVAVKLMDSGSLQGEREFQNELYFGGKINSEYVVSLIGFSSDLKRRRMALVYDLLANGSLQVCLLHRKCPELMDWNLRFLIALNIAKGLEYLHHFCDPPIIHGDIKPSNILLDVNYSAKIGDFGLAKMKSLEIQSEIRVKNEVAVENNGFEIDEKEITVPGGITDFDGSVNQSLESCFFRADVTPESMAETESVVSPRIVAAMVSPADKVFGISISADNFDSVASFSETSNDCDKKSMKKKKVNKNGSNRNDGNERPKSKWIRTLSSSRITGKKEIQRKLKWWMSLDDDKDLRKPAREWWKEEYTEELNRKNKNKKKKIMNHSKQEQESVSDGGGSKDMEKWYFESDPKKKNRSRSSWSSMDWWSDGMSGDLLKTRKNSYDSASAGGGGGVGFSSTPSLRGTVCYIAPEYRIRGDLSEKCDVYSYGVLLLVLIAGRRPLEVTGSSMADFYQANLLSWARRLAQSGRILELVDQKVHSLDKEQALLCINVALLCLQKSPCDRPSMQEIIGILSGELVLPELPPEFSQVKHNKSRKKEYY